MFQHLGNLIARRPGWLILVWVAAIGAAAIWIWRARPVAPPDAGAVLPIGHAWYQATQRMGEAFPKLKSRSMIAVIAFRDSGVTPTDLGWMGQVGEQVKSAFDLEVLSPTVPFLRHRLVSGNGKAAMLIVNLPTSFISPTSAKSVDQVEAIVRGMPCPAGLVTEITGTAGIGRDYAVATQKALHRTIYRKFHCPVLNLPQRQTLFPL